MQHTPGPWTYDGKGTVRSREGWALASVPYTLGGPQDATNARLMAAAPDLLEAAVGALLWLDNLERSVGKDTLLDCLPNNCNGRIGLREAIRKATEASDPPPPVGTSWPVAAGLLLRTLHDALHEAELTDAQRAALEGADASIRAALVKDADGTLAAPTLQTTTADLTAAASLLLRTVNDTLRHPGRLSLAQYENLEAAAAGVRDALRGGQA